jgi:signal transduction histidine kinase
MGTVSDMGYLGVRTVFFILIGYIVCHLMTEQRAQRQELDKANQRLVRYAATLEELAISQERNRLARELHDTLAHTLSALAVQLDAIATVWVQVPPRVRTMLQRALAMTRTGLDDTRRALGALRATPLEDVGLAAAVSQLAEAAAARGGLALHLEVSESPWNLVPEVEQCYYRVAQEAIENVVKHAQARSMRVSLLCEEGSLLLQVADDGLGFSVETLEAEPEPSGQRNLSRAYEGSYTAVKFGIRGMQERAELIGASLEIESTEGGGTIVRLRGGDRTLAGRRSAV